MKGGLLLCLLLFSVLYTVESKALETVKKGEYFVSSAFTSEIVPEIKLGKYLERGVGDSITSSDVRKVTNGEVFVNGFTFGFGRMFDDMALSGYFSHSGRTLSQDALQLSDGMKITSNSVGISVVRYLSNMKIRPFFGVAVDIASADYVLSGVKSFDENWQLADKAVRVNGSWERLSCNEVLFGVIDPVEGEKVEYNSVCLAADANGTCHGSDTPVSYVAFKNKLVSLKSNDDLKATSGMKLGFSVTSGLSFRVNNVMIEGFVGANLKPKLQFNERSVYVNSNVRDVIADNFISYNDVRSTFAGEYAYAQQNNVCTVPEPDAPCSYVSNNMMSGVDVFSAATVNEKTDLSSYTYGKSTTSCDEYNNLVRTYIPQEVTGRLTYTLGVRALLLF